MVQIGFGQIQIVLVKSKIVGSKCTADTLADQAGISQHLKFGRTLGTNFVCGGTKAIQMLTRKYFGPIVVGRAPQFSFLGQLVSKVTHSR